MGSYAHNMRTSAQTSSVVLPNDLVRSYARQCPMPRASKRQSDEERRAQLRAFRAWIDVIVETTGLTRSEIARRAELTPSTINKPYSQLDYDKRISLPTINAIERIAKIPAPDALLMKEFPAQDADVNDSLTTSDAPSKTRLATKGASMTGNQHLMLLEEVMDLPMRYVGPVLRLVRRLKGHPEQDEDQNARPPQTG